MPYIKPELRPYIDKRLENIVINDTAELNYAIHELIASYLLHAPSLGIVKYNHLESVLGCLNAVSQEFNRRVVVPYEDLKREENGDINLYSNFNSLSS